MSLLEPNRQDYFWYRQNGEVIPHPNLNRSQQERARYTIDLLNLNCSRLVRRRRMLIQETIIEIDNLLNDFRSTLPLCQL